MANWDFCKFDPCPDCRHNKNGICKLTGYETEGCERTSPLLGCYRYEPSGRWMQTYMARMLGVDVLGEHESGVDNN